MLDAEKFPTATYKGKLTGFKNGAPTEVQGSSRCTGSAKPVNLKINQFLCKKHPMSGKDVCGADASGTFDRSAFGVDYGKAYGFKQDVKLLISIEAPTRAITRKNGGHIALPRNPRTSQPGRSRRRPSG